MLSQDLAVLDCQLVRAPADQPDKIREVDPPIRAKRPVASYNDFPAVAASSTTLPWLTGNSTAHGKPACPRTARCPEAGRIRKLAVVEKEDEPLRQFLVWRIKRYDLEKLASACEPSVGIRFRLGYGSEKAGSGSLSSQ